MNIVDAQIHIWGTGLPSNAAHWPITAFSAAEALALMDEAGVDAAVIHPPSWDPGSQALALEAVRAQPHRFAIMGTLPLDDPQGSSARLASWKQQPGMLGLRYTVLHEPARQWMADGSLDWLWRGAEAHDIPIALLCTDSLASVGHIAERHPGLRLTVDHLGGRGGNTTAKDAAAMTHLPELLALARHPNVAVKATGMPGYAGQPYPYPAMQDCVRRVFDAFGPERLFWGTDISKMPCSWRECISMFTEAMDWLSGDDLRLVMGDAVCAWWRWQRG